MMHRLLCVIISSLIISSVCADVQVNDQHWQDTITHGSEVPSSLAGFDINQAYTQLMYAYSAYCPESVISNWTCFFCSYNSSAKGFKPYAVVENPVTNTFVYMGSKGSTVEVVFRGTQSNSIVNWITDFDYAHSVPYKNVPNAFVHSGFLDAYEVVSAKLRTAVMNLVASVKPTQVYFTGHSLGAALTTLCALDLGPDLKVPFAVYNFGSPRVGNPAFADYFHSKVSEVYRVVNRGDIVPHLPDLKMGYHHISQEVWWNTATSYKVCDTSGEDPKCSDSLVLYDIPDHLSYLATNLDQGGC